MVKKIKLAIIGFGRMGITHFSILNSNPNVLIESLTDPSNILLSQVNKYISINTYKSYIDLFENTSPDAIIVCTPPKYHFPIIQKAYEKDIHVFVEKPFTSKYEEANALKLMYGGKKLVNQVGYVNRFNDVFCYTKDLLDIGLIGKIIRFKSEMFSCTITKPDEGSGWRSSRESGGGVVFEMASHAIDLVNFLVGKPDIITGTSFNKIYSKNVEDAMSTTCLYKNGTTGTIYVNWSDPSYRKPTNKIEIFGEDGRILADQHSIKIFLNNQPEGSKFRQGWNTLYITDLFKSVPFYVRGNEFTRQLYHFIDCIVGNEINNKCSFSHGVDSIEIIENIFTDYELNSKKLNGAN